MPHLYPFICVNASNSFPLPDALEDGAEQVGGVEAREADEEQVERVPHLLPRDDDRRDRVAHNPEDGERRLQEEKGHWQLARNSQGNSIIPLRRRCPFQMEIRQQHLE